MRTGLTARPEGQQVETHGVRLHYTEVGAGAPLLALHGGGPGENGWNCFRQNVPALAQHFQVRLLDLPQFGASDPVVIREPRAAFYARCIQGFLQALGVQKTHVVGISLGGLTALKCAAEYPDLVDRLVVLGALTGAPSIFAPLPAEGARRSSEAFENPTKGSLLAMMQLLVYDPSLITDELIEERLREARREPFREARRQSSRQVLDVTAELAQVRAKTLLLWGRDDRFAPLDLGLTQLARIPEAHLYVIPRCGHWVPYEARATFDRLVADWLTSE